MANTRSALKRVRKTERETLRNKALKSRVKTFRRRVNAAIEAGDAKAAQDALGDLASAADKAGRSRVIHPNSASRLKSIYSRRISALG
ncbi:MAG: 30S ribosomal protein S20 [Verrucomicrobiae bacterium]|nr:30S ribosomal protein S20 [Verrucomicrobiae bacterium]MCB1087717.1 30S ribosomal protein S20 [Verrucomicrobiae bacterium]